MIYTNKYWLKINNPLLKKCNLQNIIYTCNTIDYSVYLPYHRYICKEMCNGYITIQLLELDICKSLSFGYK